MQSIEYVRFNNKLFLQFVKYFMFFKVPHVAIHTQSPDSTIPIDCQCLSDIIAFGSLSNGFTSFSLDYSL